jgi:hypothetical protein
VYGFKGQFDKPKMGRSWRRADTLRTTKKSGVPELEAPPDAVLQIFDQANTLLSCSEALGAATFPKKSTSAEFTSSA